jgi:hypothetical protein
VLATRAWPVAGRAAIRPPATSGVVARAVRHGRPAEDGGASARARNPGSGEIGVDEAGLVQVGGAEIGTGKNRAGEDSAAEVGALEILAGQVLFLVAALPEVFARAGGAIGATATPASCGLGAHPVSLPPIAAIGLLAPAVTVPTAASSPRAGLAAFLSVRERRRCRPKQDDPEHRAQRFATGSGRTHEPGKAIEQLAVHG